MFLLSKNILKTIIAAGLTNQGRVRKQNEDNWFADPKQGLFIVSDGMGGHVAGELASRIVVEVLPPLLIQRLESIPNLSDPMAIIEIVLEALSELNDHVRDESGKHLGLSGMGATVVLALIRNTYALIAHVGDSRAYLLREGHLERLTKDHSLVQILIDAGELTPEDAITHPARSKITQYIGMKGDVLPEARIIDLLPDDRLLLCSDGLTGMVHDPAITELLLANPDPEKTCHALIETANIAGGRDNITVIVVDWSGKT